MFKPDNIRVVFGHLRGLGCFLVRTGVRSKCCFLKAPLLYLFSCHTVFIRKKILQFSAVSISHIIFKAAHICLLVDVLCSSYVVTTNVRDTFQVPSLNSWSWL